MQLRRFILALITGFTCLGLAGYIYIGNFTRMLADDFCSIYIADRLGLLRSVWYWYLNWSGRYTAFALDWLILNFVLGPYRLHYVVPITLFIWLAFTTIVVYFHLRRNSFLHSFALASIFIFTVLMLSPDIPQSLFWWNGMRSYALPLVVITFYFFMFQIGTHYLKITSVFLGVLSFIVFFASGGMGETFAIAQAVFILFLIGVQLINWQSKSKAQLFILGAGLAGAICSIVVIVLAPGNAVRQALLPPSPSLAKTVSISLQAYGKFISELLFDPIKITGLIGAILVVSWISRYYKDYSVSTGIRLMPIYLLGGVVLSFVCFPPGVYGYSEPPPSRIIIIPVFFLTGCILYASFIMGAWLERKYSPVWLNSNLLILLIVLLIGFSTIKTTLGLFKMRDIYVNFAHKWDQVDAQVLQAKANHLNYINIPAMDNWAGLERPTDNPKYWPTLCYSSYYGIQVFGPPYP